jgi:putative CocE/NonD family hydrolase
MMPGEVYAITIELFPTANVFARGHRLRLDISSSNFPHFDINPNSGEPEGSMEHPCVADNRVYVNAVRPAHVCLADDFLGRVTRSERGWRVAANDRRV